MHIRLFAVGVGLVLSSQLVVAQDALRYRAYALDSSVEAVLMESGVRAADVKVLHERPALIEELEWRAPYARSGDEHRDPVRSVVFSFCDRALYQVLVTYDSARTDGLNNSDVISALTPTYGAPVASSAKNRPLDAAADTVVLAQWDRVDASVTLLRGVYSSEYQLLLTSKTLGTRARGAIREAERLDIADAPRREREQRSKDAAAAATALEKIRAANKAAFRP
jgi:hypothetical protein